MFGLIRCVGSNGVRAGEISVDMAWRILETRMDARLIVINLEFLAEMQSAVMNVTQNVLIVLGTGFIGFRKISRIHGWKFLNHRGDHYECLIRKHECEARV